MAQILVVDANPGMLRAVKRLLMQENHSVEAREDGREALQFLQVSKPGSYSLIITATNAGRMTGVELIEQIRSSTLYTKTPIILFTAYDRDAIRRVFGINMSFLETNRGVTYLSKTDAVAKLKPTVAELTA